MASGSGSEDIEQRLARIEQQDHQIERMLALLGRQETAKPRRSWDAYAAVLATLIGLLALVISGYTAYVQRQQLRAQVWPYLTVSTSDVSPVVGLHVVNSGTGLARKITVRVTVDKKLVTSWWHALEAMGAKPEGVVISQLSSMVVPAGKDVMIIGPNNEETTPQFKQLFLSGQHAIVVTICYCSVLDECWVVASDATPDAIADPDACPITAVERFKQ
jgi:hypothetical protein